MDKRGAKILIGCILSTIVVLILFIIAFKFAQPTCELIFIEPTQLRNAALASFADTKPIRSHDKSTLMKISAFLEYITQSPNNSLSLSPGSDGQIESFAPGGNQMQSQNGNQQQQGSQPLQTTALAPGQSNQQQQQSSLNQQNLVSISGKHPAPSIVQSGFTNQQLQNSSFSINQTQMNRDKRFLPLELGDLEVNKLRNKTKYTLSFNCSTMTMILVRRFDRVYFEDINLDLNPQSKRKSTCDLSLPSDGVFGVQVHDGWAHYYCDKPLRYSCFHYNSKHPNKPGVLLAELVINSIEFEIGTNSSHKSHEFLGVRKECDI